MTQLLPGESTSVAVELIDDFSDARGEGDVIGSTCRSGHARLGVDIESVFSIDNGAMRVAPLVQAGFGRAALSYGPFAGRAGLAFAVFMLNGHNTAQDEPLSDTFRQRLRRWQSGSETQARWQRIVWWLRSARFKRALRQVRWWHRTAHMAKDAPRLNENLAVGWYSGPAEPDPRLRGSGFIMHALGPENGELWAGEANCRTRALRGVQNLPLYYVGIVRPEGTIYYVSSGTNAQGLAAHPAMRPIALDDRTLSDQVFLGIQQGVLGQVGFRLDSRIYGVRVGQIEEYRSWFGGAHAADAFDGGGHLLGTTADVGGGWQVWNAASGSPEDVLPKADATEVAFLDPKVDSGLIHASLTHAMSRGYIVGIMCRGVDAKSCLRLELSDTSAVLALVIGGSREVLASRKLGDPRGDGVRYLQILDDGLRLRAYVDGEPLADALIEEPRLNGATNVGVFSGGAGIASAGFRRFEAHPRLVRLPAAFDMGAPWMRRGTKIVIADDFSAGSGDLDGRVVSNVVCWQRVMGEGYIDVSGNRSARVRASREAPCPGRTAYCLDWSNPDFAELEVTITPPGRDVGEGHKTMGGLILYQDPDNFVILNAYRTDYYPGGSVSTFFRLGGYEDVYDAIWSNVGSRITYGEPLRLGLTSDGERYLVFINDEPVLYRAFRDVYSDAAPIRIRKIGIVANWEFGTDTGSQFEHFIARI
jgi:hypothetical protein